MPEFPYVAAGAVRTLGATAGTSSVATTLTAHASANTKGTVVELVSATEFDANWILVQTQSPGHAYRFFIDILSGASTETVIIPNLNVVVKSINQGWSPFLFPISIAKGTRIAARCQASTGSGTIRVATTLFSGTIGGGGGSPWVAEYGATASTQGTNVDPGATPNTDSAWVEITSATVRDHHWLVAAIQFGDQTITAGTHKWRFSVGIGAASSEKVLIPGIHVSADTTCDVPFVTVFHWPVYIPLGSRLTAKVRETSGTDGDRDIWVKLYGAG